MKRLPGPSDEQLIAVIKDGPIDSFLLGERFGCNARMAAARCGALQKAGVISVFRYRIYKRGATTREKAKVWYIPGCGIPIAEYQGLVMASRQRRPRKKTTATMVGIDDDDLEWMHRYRMNAERKKAQLKSIRG